MPTTTISVVGKADPERGKTRGRIKADGGMLFQADPEFLDEVVVGESYDVTYTDEEFKNFKYRVVQEVNPASGKAKPPPPRQPEGGTKSSNQRNADVGFPGDFKDEGSEYGVHGDSECKSEGFGFSERTA